MATKLLSVATTADIIGVPPPVLSNLIYRDPVLREACPLVAGRRAVPENYVETLRWALRRAGKLPRRQGVENA